MQLPPSFLFFWESLEFGCTVMRAWIAMSKSGKDDICRARPDRQEYCSMKVSEDS